MRRLAIALLALGLAACSNPARGVPIFLWHAVGTGCAGAPYDVPPAEFDRELSDLERWGAHPITLAQLFDAREGKTRLPPRAVILTFDDGHRCQLTEAGPLLAKHHMVAETFVTTSLLGAPGYLTWDDLRAMDRSGTWVVESHGVHHERLSQMHGPEQREELADSKRALEDHLGRPVQFFAYPFGSYTASTRDLAEQAGYRAALSVSKGWGRRYELRRVSLWAGAEPNLVGALTDAFGRAPH